jgi:2'-hydroxyisoflavone reductase
MQVLILGGTRFLGRAIVEAALGRGDTVTLFNRGRTNPGLYPGAETIIGDRTGELKELSGRHWDIIVDVAAYEPDVVRRNLAVLAGQAEHYVFVSTISVYAGHSVTQFEDSPSWKCGTTCPRSSGTELSRWRPSGTSRRRSASGA